MNRQDFILLFITSVGLVLSLPPFPTGGIALGALVPFLFIIRKQTTKRAIRAGFLIGFLWGVGTLYWIGRPTMIGLAGAMLWFPLSFTLFSVVTAFLHRKWGNFSFWFAPFTWTGIEIIFSWGEMGFPWNSLANSQTSTPVMIQYASIVGMHGVTFWVVTVNVLIFYLILQWSQIHSSSSNGKTDDTLHRLKKKGYRLVIVLLLLISLPWAYGHQRIRRFDRSMVSGSEPSPSDRSVHIALVQGNIDPYRKWSSTFIDSNFSTYAKLTRQGAEHHPDLIVWPETAAPCYLRRRFSCMNRVKRQVDSLQIPILTGALDAEWSEDGNHKIFNSAYLLKPNSWDVTQYNKMKLVPFGERVPLVGHFPVLYDLAKKTDLDVGGFSPGDSVVVFELNDRNKDRIIPFATVICYESIFPYFVRKFIQNGARFLVIITNDGWFGNTSGPYQHAQIAVMRAIENGIGIARCANTGISEIIDPMGRIVKRTSFNKEEILTGRIDVRDSDTIFLKAGAIVPGFILGMNGMIFLSSFIVPLRSRIFSDRRRKGPFRSVGD